MLSRCSTCECKFRPVPGNGPEPSDILFIGDRPGKDSNKIGIPLAGMQGREFNENYLWLAGLNREDIRITDTVKCFAEGKRKTSEKEIRECGGHHLPDEITECDPSVIVLMGGTACSLVPDLDLDIEHGIPRWGRVFDWEGTIIPMYHPSAGLHDTGKMIPILEDFERMGKVLRGEWEMPEDPYPNPEYKLVRNTWELVNSFTPPPHPPHLVSIDTERHGEDAFSIQFSSVPGTGYMILQSDRVTNRLSNEPDLFRVFNSWLSEIQSVGAEVVLHNAPQDLDWLDRMGIKVTKFRDTMQEAYHLGNLPQGLKALSYRLLGIRMRTYGDVVIPYSREKVTEWMLSALDNAETTLTRVEYKQLKTKVKEIQKPSEIEKMLRRVLRYTLDNPNYDPWEKLAEFRGGDKELVEWAGVESTFGPPPIVGIGNVPMDEAVRYGCADADITLRVALELEKRRKALTGVGGELEVGEGDRDQ